MKQKSRNCIGCRIAHGFVLSIVLLLFLPYMAMAVVDAPPDVYVGDYANVLMEETEQYIIGENLKLAEATGAQIVVVTVDFLDGMEIEDYAYTIFNEWGIGDANQNNGLLLLLAIGEENYWAMQGAGLEGVLSSGTLGDYLYDYLEPDFAVGHYDAGVYKVFNAFLEWFAVYYDLSEFNANAGVVTMPYEEQQEDEGVSFWLIVIIILIIIIILSLHNRRKDQNNKHNNRRGGSGGGRYYEPDEADGYGRSTRRTVYIPTGRMGVPPTSNNSGSDLFGGGSSRGGGVGRRTGSFGGGFGSSSGGFGGGSGRGGGAGRR